MAASLLLQRMKDWRIQKPCLLLLKTKINCARKNSPKNKQAKQKIIVTKKKWQLQQGSEKSNLMNRGGKVCNHQTNYSGQQNNQGFSRSTEALIIFKTSYGFIPFVASRIWCLSRY